MSDEKDRVDKIRHRLRKKLGKVKMNFDSEHEEGGRSKEITKKISLTSKAYVLPKIEREQVFMTITNDIFDQLEEYKNVGYKLKSIDSLDLKTQNEKTGECKTRHIDLPKVEELKELFRRRTCVR